MKPGRKLYKTLLTVALAVLLAGAGQVQRALNRDRTGLGLTPQTPLENAPPLLAFTTVALGGFRGLIANVLWIRATDLQIEGKYFETVQLADWITKLQPRFTTVWMYQAWNMAYNISVKFTDPRDRWFWVQRGIQLLRDEALVYNPRSADLYRELAWLYQHKVGYFHDDAHGFYKQSLANEMTALLGGGRPDFDALMDPQTDEARERVRLLRAKFGMSPALMRRVDETYGPLEWRLPEAHAIYWAGVGLEKAAVQNPLPLHRVIYQSLRMAFLRGRLIPNVAERAFEVGPNLEVAPRLDALFARLMEEDPEHRESLSIAHKDFLRQAAYLFYVHSRPADAARWFQRLRELYPGTVPEDVDLDQFAVLQIGADVERTSIDRTRAAIDGLLTSAYFNVALGEADHAAGLERLALRVWQRHQARFAGQEQRAGFPPFERMKQEALARLLDPERGLNPQLQAQLRTTLGLPAGPPAPTNP